jgi:hypothetical protein
MPKLDGTGPQGQGPRTGRGLGNCQGTGQGMGRGLGQGRGRMGETSTKEEKRIALEEEKKAIEQEIANLDA